MRVIDFLQFIQDLSTYFTLYFKSDKNLLPITTITQMPDYCLFNTKQATNQPLNKLEIEKLLLSFKNKNTIIKVADTENQKHYVYGIRIENQKIVLV